MSPGTSISARISRDPSGSLRRLTKSSSRRSTNEELETMNEELQSTNEELETINNELRERTSEVTDLNQFLQAILGSLRSAVVVLGMQMDIKAWNRQAEELWGLRSDEVI